jgi:hypothetical protein
MPYKHNQDRRHKFDKGRYSVKNWPEYDQALKNRRSLSIWLTKEAINAWQPENLQKKRGGQPVYSDVAIETGLTLRSLYKLGLRQTEGFLESISSLMGLALSIPDHTTFSRRSSELNITQFKREIGEPIHILVDSTGLKISGSGEWQETKHGLQKRKHWRKLHLAIDEATGNILASELTTHKNDDPSQVPILLDQIDEEIESMIADGAYDTREVYDALSNHKSGPIQGIMPPRKDAVLSDNALASPTTRDQNIICIKEKGRLNWQKETGYNRRSLVETAMFRYKIIIGGQLRSRSFENQKTEAIIGVAILDKMTNLGMPVSVRA